MNGCWPTLECLSYFARFSPQGVQNSTSMYTSGEIHSCAVGSAENLQSSLLPFAVVYCRFTVQAGLHFIHSLHFFCEQVTTKPKKLLQPIVMNKPQNNRSPVTNIFRQISKLFYVYTRVLKICLARPFFSLTFPQYTDIVTVLSLDLNIKRTVYLTVF